jgi:uncharacterized protein (DUF885 family)
MAVTIVVGHCSAMTSSLTIPIVAGIHFFGWSKQQAMDYLLDHVPMNRRHAEDVVNFYITWPGHATSYRSALNDTHT